MISSYFSFDYHVENAECDEFSSNDFTDKKDNPYGGVEAVLMHRIVLVPCVLNVM